MTLLKKIIFFMIAFHWVLTLGVILLIANPMVVSHFNGPIITATDTKWVLLLGPAVTSIIGVIILYVSKYNRLKNQFTDFPGILIYEGYYLGGLGIAIAVFIGLMLDQIGLTTLFT